MTRALATAVAAPKGFTDVVYLTDEGRVPSEIKKLLKEKKLSFLTLSVGEFPSILPQLELIGTVIIDAENLDVSNQLDLARIIESLEVKNIGVILLCDKAIDTYAFIQIKISSNHCSIRRNHSFR